VDPPFKVALLPGVVLPAEPAYGALVAALGAASDARAKDLELYRQESPSEDYSLDAEVDGLLRAAGEWGLRALSPRRLLGGWIGGAGDGRRPARPRRERRWGGSKWCRSEKTST